MIILRQHIRFFIDLFFFWSQNSIANATGTVRESTKRAQVQEQIH